MSFVRPSTQTFPFPAQHADNPDGVGPRFNGAPNGDGQSQGLPDGDGRTGDPGNSDAAENRGQLGGDDDSVPGRSGHSEHGNGNGNGVGNGNGNGNGNGVGNGGNGGPENTGPGQQTLPGQSYPGMPDAGGRTGGLGGNGSYGNGNGSGGVNHGGGIYAGGAQTPNQGGLGGIISQVSQVASSITSAVFGSPVANPLPNNPPNLFTEHMPHFVGDSATQTQPSNDHASSPQPSPPSPQRAANDASPLPSRNADPTPQPAAPPATGSPEAEGRGLLAQASTQPGIDARTAQMLAQGGAPLVPMEHAPESPAQMAGMLAATAKEAEALERALTDGQNKAPPQRADVKDMAAQLRQAAAPEGEVNTSQQMAQSRQPTDALDRMLAKMQPDARTASDARGADGRPLDARTADGRLVATDGRLVQADGTLRSATDASRQSGDLAKTATATTEGGRLPVGADGKSAQSSFGRGLFGGAAEYTRQALDWVGQQVREFGFGASPDADGARAMRVVAGLVVASVGVLVVIGVLYALRIIFVA